MGLRHRRQSARFLAVGAFAVFGSACGASSPQDPPPTAPAVAPARTPPSAPPSPSPTSAAPSAPPPAAQAGPSEAPESPGADEGLPRIVVVPCRRGESEARCQARAKVEALAEAGDRAEWIATTMGDAVAGYVSEVEIDGKVERFTDPDLQTATNRLTELARAGRRVTLLRGERVTGGRVANVMVTTTPR